MLNSNNGPDLEHITDPRIPLGNVNGYALDGTHNELVENGYSSKVWWEGIPVLGAVFSIVDARKKKKEEAKKKTK